MDAADVTGPGTAPMVRPRAAAWFAVVNDPDRTPASTTTVAAVVAAISRLRARKRQRVGGRAGGDLAGDRAAALGDPGDQLAVPGRVGAVGSAGQPGDGGPARGILN